MITPPPPNFIFINTDTVNYSLRTANTLIFLDSAAVKQKYTLWIIPA